jgi:hypothetical protein
MNKLFDLFLRGLLVRLLALQMAFYPLAPVVYRGALTLPAVVYVLAADIAEAACSGGACFWIGGTGTVDGTSDNGKWSLTTGGASCACVPNTTDTVTFDSSSGTGTVTINMGGGTWTTGSFAFTTAASLTIDFATNSNSWASAAGSFSATGASTKTLNMGSGTFSIQSASSGTNWDTSGSGLTLNAGTSTISIAASTSTNARRFFGGSKTYATISLAGGANSQLLFANAGFTAAALTIAAPNTISFGGGNTHTITTLTTVTGTSSTPVIFKNDGPLNGRAIISSANNWTCTWCGFTDMQFQGGGTFTANSSLTGANNTGITINPPSAGGGGVPKFIGG